MYTFIQQGHIKLITSDINYIVITTVDFNIVTKDFYFK